MNRAELLARVTERGVRWDVLVIGGGATGLGAALDAITRGYRTLLLERGDFACGTSSRSTKLIHGGVRYLRQGNIALVRESLRERALLLRNAPTLVHAREFVVPCYHWWEAPFYGVGLKFYDALAGRTLPKSRHLSRGETLDRLPTLNPCGLRGGELYYDAQFDDARLAILLAQNSFAKGGVALNYAPVVELLRSGFGRVSGARMRDLESNATCEIEAKVVVNATGVFCDEVRRLEQRDVAKLLAPSQGAHLVLPREFLPGDAALMIPRTDDGRVLFAIPWHGRVLVGTTDTAVREVTSKPRPLEIEVDFLLKHAARYFTKAPERGDILSMFAGLRPLVKRAGSKQTSRLARDHVIEISAGGLVTVTGGKWTTYRKMAEDVIDTASRSAGLEPRPCVTENLRLDENLSADESQFNDLRFGESNVRRAARTEFARTVEDVLARRTRALFLDARASIEAAPRVAAWLAAELGRDDSWQREQVELFTKIARGYDAQSTRGE